MYLLDTVHGRNAGRTIVPMTIDQLATTGGVPALRGRADGRGRRVASPSCAVTCARGVRARLGAIGSRRISHGVARPTEVRRRPVMQSRHERRPPRRHGRSRPSAASIASSSQLWRRPGVAPYWSRRVDSLHMDFAAGGVSRALPAGPPEGGPVGGGRGGWFGKEAWVYAQSLGTGCGPRSSTRTRPRTPLLMGPSSRGLGQGTDRARGAVGGRCSPRIPGAGGGGRRVLRRRHHLQASCRRSRRR